MKKILVCSMVLLFMVTGFAGTAFSADVKVGIVNIQRILNESNAGKAIQAKLNTSKQNMEKDLNAKGQAIEALSQKLERDAGVMSPDMRAEQERQGRAKVNEFRALEATYAQDLQSMEARYLDQIQKELSDVVNNVAQKGNYTIIMNSMSVLYFQKVIDITDEVIKELNGRNIKIN